MHQPRPRPSTRGETIGRSLIAAATVTTAAIQPMADLNHSHAFNEDWPPHAHFHGLAALGMLEICSATSLYLLLTRRGDRRLNTAIAAILPASFWLPFLPAHFVTGSSLDDGTAHHPSHKVPRIGPLKMYPNGTTAVVQLGLLAAGWWTFRSAIGHTNPVRGILAKR